ncbi:hypothetical protein PX699_17715 [Sphingobium sp. H39-3-25]|uniref:hypothetical protein n=1 Tax=Sphingobium arseniciresistens TaxID=3030834 RepID=UPI0023B97310|nr:hypothetical protein [Sphingobium arseniciresistens]
MSASGEYNVQKFRGGYALVWWESGGSAELKRRRRQLAAKDRESAKSEARFIWDGADNSPWTLERLMTAYLASIEGKPSHSRRQDAWKAMWPYWENIEPAAVDEIMCKQSRLTRSVSDSTARYELMQLSTAMN